MSTSSPTVSAPPASVQDESVRSSSFQPEIQGLRALAVILVVVYHFWPWRLSGGYVGVDVFFVISGYLITAHLLREATATGTIRLGRFWARRIRRLLPLSLLVLLLTALAAVAILPSTAWHATVRQVIASALYVQNWILAADSVDYSKMDEQATAVQHFWSLSVEEQFYVLWPLLLVVVLLLAGAKSSRSGDQVRKIFIAVISVLGAASFLYSVWYTAQEPAQAYFVTPTRIWEFALGALLALVLGARQFHGRWGNLLGWLGLAMILLSAYFYSDLTAFPGYTALLPTVGAVLMMACGGKERFTGLHWWFSRKPATKIGDWSYAIYLWHWPVLVFAPYVHPAAESLVVKVLLVLGVIALSAFTTRFFETPIRKAKILAPTGRSLLAAAAGMGIVIATAHYSVAVMEDNQVQEELSEDHPCYGFRALDNPEECGDPIEGDLGLYPPASEVAAQPQNPVYPDCQAETEHEGLYECWLGDEDASEEDVIAVVGDSHATMWLPALDQVAQENQRALLVMTRSSCGPMLTGRESGEDECQDANREIFERLVEEDAVSTVVLAASQRQPAVSAPPEADELPSEAQGTSDTAQAFLTPIQLLLDADKEVVVFGEAPRLNEERNEEETLPECVALHEDDLSACHDDLEDTRVEDRWLTQSQEVFEDRENYHFIPTENLVCDDSTCYSVLGGAITYNDNSHVSQNFVRSATDEIARRLEPALNG